MESLVGQISTAHEHGPDIIRYRWLFAPWVLLFAPASMVQIKFGAHYFTLVDFWLPMFALLQLALVTIRPVNKFDRRYVTRYIVVFLIYIGVISYGFAYAADKAGVFKELAKWLEILLISIGVILYVRNDRRFANLYWAMFFTLLGICIHHIFQNILRSDLFARMWVPVDWAVILSMPFLSVAWVQIIFLVILVPSLVLSYSRLTWASSALAFGVLGLFAKNTWLSVRRIRRIIISVFSICGLVSVFVPGFIEIVVRRVMVTFNTKKDYSAFVREGMIKASILDFIHHPLLGIGAGNFKNHAITHQRNINFWISPEALPNSPHSVLLQTAAELGVPGLIAFSLLLSIILVGIKRGRKVARCYAPMAPYSVGMALFTIPLFITLIASNIGELYRVIIGLYFGLAISMFRLYKVYTNR